MQRLRVSDNQRFLAYDNGTPFFYLGDTAWELFHRLSRGEAETYLRDRARKRFTVIQAVILAEHEYDQPNAYGAFPLHDNDPAQPNEAYFEHVDWIVNCAESLGLTVGLLPTWGDKWNKAWGAGPEIFTPSNARTFGEFLGHRYADKPLIWILGGDRPLETDAQRAILRAMSEGLTAGDGGSHLQTFHPPGRHSSTEYVLDEPWVNFHLWQTGHSRNNPAYDAIASDYARTPVKPVLDSEPGYEDHPAGFSLDNGYLDDYDVRKALYWGLFAGGCGSTYGCHDIWQFLDPSRFKPVSWGRTVWQDALHLPGSGQVQYARALLESRPYFTRIPDSSLLVSEAGDGSRHIQATRDEAGTYALIYIAALQTVEVDLGKLNAATIAVHWFDPRTGLAQRAPDVAGGSVHAFTPPTLWPDWVLVLDDAAQNYPTPGTGTFSR